MEALPGVSMARDGRDIVDLLKKELDFIERGGYSHAWQRPWIPASVFEDSPTCLSREYPDRPPKCEHCALFQFVPVLFRGEAVPCHHIPLGSNGETIYTLERQSLQKEVEDAVKTWLQLTIYQIEQKRAKEKPPSSE